MLAPGAQGLTKIDSSTLMARLLGMAAPFVAQPVNRGALSTLYAATAPELTGALPMGWHGCGACLCGTGSLLTALRAAVRVCPCQYALCGSKA